MNGMVKNGFANGKQRWKPAVPRAKKQDTILQRLENIVVENSPISTERIEFEYVAKYGPLKVRTMHSLLSNLYHQGLVARIHNGLYA